MRDLEHANWPKQNGRGKLSAKHRACERGHADVGEHPRDDPPPAECRQILPDRVLTASAAADVVEGLSSQALPGQVFERRQVRGKYRPGSADTVQVDLVLVRLKRLVQDLGQSVGGS